MLEVLSQRPHTVERMVVASSMSIYGEGAYRVPSTGAVVAPPLRSHEQLSARQWELSASGEQLVPVATTEEKLLKPASIYAINKRDHEEMFLAVGMALQIPTVALRLFNAYGSRQALSNPYTGVAAIFISRLQNDQPPLVFEDGLQQRDFVHVQDVADAFVAALGEREAGLRRLQRRQRHSDHRRRDGARAGADASQGHRAADFSASTGSATFVTAFPDLDKDRKRVRLQAAARVRGRHARTHHVGGGDEEARRSNSGERCRARKAETTRLGRLRCR